MVVILMGVSGSGKTTIGLRLAGDLGWRFIDADDFHSAETLRATSPGQPISDENVRTWMEGLRAEVSTSLARSENVVVAYSALKTTSRQELVLDPKQVRFVYLKGSPKLVRQRLRARSGIFRAETFLVDQFTALEEPLASAAIIIDIDDRPGLIVTRIRDALGI